MDWLEYAILIIADGVAQVVVGPGTSRGSCPQLRTGPLHNDVTSLFPHSFNVAVEVWALGRCLSVLYAQDIIIVSLSHTPPDERLKA